MAKIHIAQLNDIDNDLFEWFFAQPANHIFWTVYRGHQYTKKGSDVLGRNVEVLGFEQSWNKLENMVRAQSRNGGEFTILLTDKPKGNAGPNTFLTISPLGIATNQNQVQGIHGMPSAEYPFIGGQNIGAIVQKEVAAAVQAVKTEYQIAELRKEMEEWKTAALNPPAENWKDAIMQKVAADPMAFIAECISGVGEAMKVKAMMQNPNLTMQMNGMDQQKGFDVSTQDVEDQETEGNIKSVFDSLTEDEYSATDIMLSDILKKHFPDKNIHQLVFALNSKLNEVPYMAKQLFT